MTTVFTPTHSEPRALHGIHVVSLACNIPGPVAVARLVKMGATVTKVEPPGGDALHHACPEWYQELHQGVEVRCRDLKTPEAQAELSELLASADLFITATRFFSLDRLGVSRKRLSSDFPNLCHVAVVGWPPPDEHLPGHDLTYQAQLGLLEPPLLPRIPVADIAGAQEIVSSGLALLLSRERGGTDRLAIVSLACAAELFAEPLRRGLTRPDGPLGGSFAGYNLYPALDGWVAVAALEPRFWEALLQQLSAKPTPAELKSLFARRSCDEWEQWARKHDLPITAVRTR